MIERPEWFKHPDPDHVEETQTMPDLPECNFGEDDASREVTYTTSTGSKRNTAPYGYPFFEEGFHKDPRVVIFVRMLEEESGDS